MRGVEKGGSRHTIVFSAGPRRKPVENLAQRQVNKIHFHPMWKERSGHACAKSGCRRLGDANENHNPQGSCRRRRDRSRGWSVVLTLRRRAGAVRKKCLSPPQKQLREVHRLLVFPSSPTVSPCSAEVSPPEAVLRPAVLVPQRRATGETTMMAALVQGWFCAEMAFVSGRSGENITQLGYLLEPQQNILLHLHYSIMKPRSTNCS
ncbi:uncharacterized protein LOC110086561 isoform X2 [Pogona vitticeps]|uniref:Uncharacterized protein n=1 Tax=Pogona vitticeps TaxID=103695 RepID=A0ABM5G6S8_9SAUR